MPQGFLCSPLRTTALPQLTASIDASSKIRQRIHARSATKGVHFLNIRLNFRMILAQFVGKFGGCGSPWFTSALVIVSAKVD